MTSFRMKIWRRFVNMLEEYQVLSDLKQPERRLIRQIRSRKLTYLSVKKLVQIAKTCSSIEQQKLTGLFLEAGCALGGSTVLIASIKRKDRLLRVYDVFGMIPAPTLEDTVDVHERYKNIAQGKSVGIGGDLYYGYQENLYEKVQHNLASFGINTDRMGVKLIKGLLQDTMQLEQPVVFAHIDVDWYDPVKTSLERIFPQLVVNGSIILDDYFDWGGCRKATDEFLADKKDQIVLDATHGSLKITKIK